MGHETEDSGDVFRIPDLWAPSKCLSLGPDYSSFLFSKFELDDVDIKLPAIVPATPYKDPFFSIPDLSFGPTDDVPTRSEFADPPPQERLDQGNSGGFDIDDTWLLSEEMTLEVPNYRSWDAFDGPAFEEPSIPYITEAGPSIFDAAIAADEDYLRIANSDYAVVNNRAYTAALLSLGLGRRSVFFVWDDDAQTFTSTMKKMRISGYSSDSLISSLATFMDCGNSTKFLQNFVDKSYLKRQSPGQIAIADAVSSILVSVQTQLSTAGSTVDSILQLEALFRPAQAILFTFQRIVKSVSSTRSDEAMLSTIFQEAQIFEHRTDSLRDILLELLSRVTKPWLEFSSEWLGLRREVGLPLSIQGKGKGFVKVANRQWVNEQGEELFEPDFVLDYDRVPSFMAPDDARSMFEVGRSLRFLKTLHPQHPLSKDEIVTSANPPSLDWHFSWQDIIQVETKALKFETDLIAALENYSAKWSASHQIKSRSIEEDFQLDVFGRPAEEMEAHVLASIKNFDQEPEKIRSSDRLADKVVEFLRSSEVASINEESTFAPPISLTPLLSFNPIISAQARIVNGACMRMFFNSHNLREHLALQRSFHLLGNGIFSSRLSHALFDPELESAERKRGVARSGGVMGLRLGDRDTWPPASSELRLALMGILTESHVSKSSVDKARTVPAHDDTSLPGDLSFAVRDMSDEEIKKCLDPDANEALDFLRLSYKPPAPLDAVITPVILFKYDQLFKLLLRVLRMLYVVSALFRDATSRHSSWKEAETVAQRFRIEAQHFTSSISGYFFETGVEATWRIFQRKLDEVEERINDDNTYTLGPDEGIDQLRDYHEMALDKIMFALLLRKRQQPVMNLLEDIFALILHFSKYSRQQALGQRSKSDESVDVKGLYAKFRQKIGVFVNVCRGMSEKQPGERKTVGRGSLFDGSDLIEENTISQLLSRLEMSDYYARRVKT